ncbi:type IV pilus assembly protein FimV [Entomomonas asaccharolytica]|uniref:FimV N-terminal domain-containing protein n=1 Tax=Entomomonas asaccharolytica TaxID=2785331 RepID=A0A974RZ38_9GAMM|nr:FimV/HubP family polar landmark protein [Entomomonas asaccharolytica]QQP86644.1 hypothetical protein JHT90_05235 [Entomomonas asaccharolytica]
MVQFHKLAAVGLAVTLSSMGSAFALGLGEVTWKSTLNQPLDAEIALYDVQNITNKELVVKIASPEDFAKAGIDRPHALNDLVFTPVIRGNKSVIKITSNQPIKEPYLDFLLSVSWASGQTLREYTLLIDPPAYEPAKVVTSKVVAQQQTPVKQTQTKTVSRPSQKKTKPTVAAAPKGTVRAHRGSSLWLFAERTRGNASVHQAMLAIYEANPDAFIDGKMSLLKEGAVLRIPSREQMRQTGRAEALSQVLANVNGTASTTQRQMVASKVDQQPATNQPAQDQLKLSGVTETNTPSGNASDKAIIADLNNKVVQSEEELDATRRKNNELRSRMSDLEARLADMKKLVELKDNQLASLQQNMSNAQKVVNPDAEDQSNEIIEINEEVEEKTIQQ